MATDPDDDETKHWQGFQHNIYGRWNKGAQGARAPTPNTWTKCPFLCSLAALLQNFEDAKGYRKIQVFGDFKRSKFQSFPGGGAHPRTFITCFTPQTKLPILLSRNPAKVPHDPYAPKT